MAGLKVIVRLAGISIRAHYPIHSPKIKNIDLVSKGSGTLRSHITYMWDASKLTKSSVTTPIRKRNNSRRKDDIVHDSNKGGKAKNLIID
jgi:ribosomal protein L19